MSPQVKRILAMRNANMAAYAAKNEADRVYYASPEATAARRAAAAEASALRIFYETELAMGYDAVSAVRSVMNRMIGL